MNSFRQQEKLWNHLRNHVQKYGIEIIPSFWLSRPYRKNLHVKAGQKLSRHVFYHV